MKRFAAASVVELTTATVSFVNSTPALAASSGLALPVSGYGSGSTFTGTMMLQKFVTSGTGIDAVGTLTGTFTDPLARATTVAQNVRVPVNIGAATCDILHLDIGPISLDLLGLQANLSEIVLDITAQSGAGNPLGNLLCAAADLLDRPSGLARVLNDILGVLV